MKLFIAIIFLLHISNAWCISEPLNTGSLDDQTFGKDGVILLHNDDSIDTLAYFVNVSIKYEENENVHFWHLNCDNAIEFCEGRPEIEEYGVPVMLYSFRNELWEGQGCKTYKEHAFETFFNTKVTETCLNTPRLCSSIMNQTLEEHDGKNHSQIRKLYLAEKEDGDEIEQKWELESRRIQQEWNMKRTGAQLDLRNSDDRMKIYKQMMEKLHSESYEENEGEVQNIVIDMRDKYSD